ncbi:MAG: dipeptidase PepV [Firmicutes bacterium]|nr:dipeptidase PepV [Bacillota bacterium]
MDFKKAIDNSMESLVQDIAALCRINSVEGEEKPGMPFGEGVAQSLEAALKLGQDMGFKTENFDGYVGHIEYGEGEELVGILGHVDVVPAGDGWNTDPWGGVITEDKIIGRGVLDDKGPIVTCLYAMKILKELNVPLSKRVRIILGTNEETDWKCMNYYLNEVKPELPTMAFSPDSEFPLTYAELGLLQYTLTREVKDMPFIEGGNAFNSVPSSAKVELDVKFADELKKAIAEAKDPSIYTVEEKEDKLLLSVKGVGAHAAHLQEGVNAISFMMDVLGKLSITGELKEVVDFYNEHFGTCLYGEKMGVACSDEDCGPLTLNVGMIYVKDGKLVLCCDSRIPVSFAPASIIEKVQAKVAGTGYEYELHSTERPLYVPKDSKLVTTLMEAYRTVTGDYESQPQSSGGATYSRTMENCVAFGCLLPGQEDTMHMANEYLEIDKLKIWLEIMLEAIYQLAK